MYSGIQDKGMHVPIVQANVDEESMHVRFQQIRSNQVAQTPACTSNQSRVSRHVLSTQAIFTTVSSRQTARPHILDLIDNTQIHDLIRALHIWHMHIPVLQLLAGDEFVVIVQLRVFRLL